LLIGTEQRDPTLSAGSDAGWMRQAVGIIPPRRDKRQPWLQSVKEPFRPRAATTMVGQFEKRDRFRETGGAKLLEAFDRKVAGEQHPLVAVCRMYDNRTVIGVPGGLSRDKQAECGFCPPIEHRPPFRQSMYGDFAAQ